MTLNEILNFELLKIANFQIKVVTLLVLLILFFATKIILFILKKMILGRNIFKVDSGTAFALFQIIRYFLWVVVISFALEFLGIQLTVLVASSAALFVGIGLGLQHTFNDFISGFILLFDGAIKVGNVLEVDGQIVKIETIGFRTSKCIDRNDIVIIIPNSIITHNKVINWSHQSEEIRFKIEVGVSYDSDIGLVKKVLEESAKEHGEIKHYSRILARLVSFGNSSLDFELLFFSDNVFRIERIKAEIRAIILKNFRKNNISIPFPQMDVHIKNND